MTSFRKQSCFFPVYEIKSGCADPGPASTSPSIKREKQRLHSLPTSPSQRFASIAKWAGMEIVTPETNILGGFSQLKEFSFCMEVAFLLPSFIYCICGFTLVANAQSADLKSFLTTAASCIALVVFAAKLPIASTWNLQTSVRSGKLRKPELGQGPKRAQQSMPCIDTML